ncbi:MAG TPA: YbaK/EbsC family protein [Methyloceanibacter sp.]|nr:YbaK/EbsC family protein [Methyloceanibacter sp.]
MEHDQRVALVVAKDKTRVELKLVASRLGFGGLSFGNAELFAKLLGVAPGSVRGFAPINDSEARVSVVVNESLLLFAEVNCHPLENTCHDAARHRRSHALHPCPQSRAVRAASLLTSPEPLLNRRSLPIFSDEIRVHGNLGVATWGV